MFGFRFPFPLKPSPDRRFFDEKSIPADVWSVLRTASLLSVGEFRVFEIAYEQWFGEKGSEDEIERYFVGYMFKDRVPPWVRHFTNRVAQLDKEGTLDPAAFGIARRRESSEQQSRGYDFLFIAFAALFLLILLSEWTARVLKYQCMFPPCY